MIADLFGWGPEMIPVIFLGGIVAGTGLHLAAMELNARAERKRRELIARTRQTKVPTWPDHSGSGH